MTVTTVLPDTITPGAGAPLGLVSDVELRECLRQAEREMRQAYFRMLDVVAEVDQRGMAQAEGFRDCTAMVSRVLRISTAEARDRVEHAAQCVARRSPAGVPLPVQMPAAAEALRAGKLGVGQLRVITTATHQLGPQASPQVRERVEADLVSYAETFEPRRLALIARRIRDRLDPDGAAPPELEPMADACGELRLRTRRDGGVGLEGWLDNETGAQFRDLIAQLAKPRPAAEGIPDQRSTAQRQADALAEVCGLARAAHDMPTTGGEPAHVNVTIDLDALRAALGAGMLDDGTSLSAAQVRRLACDAKLIPAVLGGASEPLDMGRIRRSVPLGLRRAVTIRDKGCAFPGCNRPPRRCDVHQVVHWAEGGDTCLGNCILLCPTHHREVHHIDWSIRIFPDRVEFTPPAILDPDRRPLINTYWH